MKKIWKSLCAALGAVFCVVGLAGCNEGKSAYEIAKENNLTGAQTEAEWIQSLKGANGADGKDMDIIAVYEAAKANGYEGDFLSFLKEYLSVNVQTNNDMQTIADNMTSVVSIYCGYQRKSSSTGYWGQAQLSYDLAAGSGVVIELNKQAGNAIILTNYHVVYDSEENNGSFADEIYCYPYGSTLRFNPLNGQYGEGIKATYVGGAMDYDIAVLKVEGSDAVKNSVLTKAEYGSSETLRTGENVFAVGNPSGAGIAVTSGIISVESEYIELSALDNRDLDRDGKIDGVEFRVIRTDAAINSGNSGGGLFNARGELIGIVNAKSVGEEMDNMGYALPITQVQTLVQNILDHGGVVKRAMLGVGVSVIDTTAIVNEDGTLDIKETFCVASVNAGGAAYRKLNVGDTFSWIQINDREKQKFVCEYQLPETLLQVRKGDVVTLGVINSEGNEVTVEIPFDKDSYFTLYD